MPDRLPPPRTFQELLDQIEYRDHQEAILRAVGWVVVTVDLEFQKIIHSTGVFPGPEEALAEAGRRDAEDARGHEPGEEGWAHHVVPVYPPDPPRPSRRKETPE